MQNKRKKVIVKKVIVLEVNADKAEDIADKVKQLFAGDLSAYFLKRDEKFAQTYDGGEVAYVASTISALRRRCRGKLFVAHNEGGQAFH